MLEADPLQRQRTLSQWQAGLPRPLRGCGHALLGRAADMRSHALAGHRIAHARTEG